MGDSSAAHLNYLPDCRTKWQKEIDMTENETMTVIIAAAALMMTFATLVIKIIEVARSK